MRVLTTGTFDVPHAGHFNFLRRAAQLGDQLYVGVLSDEFVKGYKGEAPLFNEEERAILIGEAADIPTYVINDQRKFFIEYGIVGATTIAVGSDWARRNYYRQIEMKQEELDQWEFGLSYIPYTEGISTTEIIERAEFYRGRET